VPMAFFLLECSKSTHSTLRSASAAGKFSRSRAAPGTVQA
jgi:hypothetical protein